MQLTATQIITRSLRLLGVVGLQAAAAPLHVDVGLEALNEMIDAWLAEKLMLFTNRRTQLAMTVNTQTYTIGTGGAFNIERPLWIAEARTIPDTSLAAASQSELPCDVLRDEQWFAKTAKSQTGSWPTELWYDRSIDSNDRGVITIWPITQNANVALVLYTPVQLSAFADATTQYRFSQGYPEALRYNLAVRLAPTFGRPLPDGLEQHARDAKALIASINVKVPVLIPQSGHSRGGLSGAGGGTYDIRSGQGY